MTGTHVVAAVADASPGSLPHHQQVHLRSSGTGAAQTLSAAIGQLSYLGVSAVSQKSCVSTELGHG